MLHTTLDDTQCVELRQVARREVGRVSERAHFVLMSAQGSAAPEIGRRMATEPARYAIGSKRTRDAGYRDSTMRRAAVALPKTGCSPVSCRRRPVSLLGALATCRPVGPSRCWWVIYVSASISE